MNRKRMRSTLAIVTCILLIQLILGQVMLPMQRHVLPAKDMKKHLPFHLHPKYSLEKYMGKVGSNGTYPHIPLGGSVLITVYSVQVKIGTPPVTFTVALDTGSSDLIIPLGSCQGCRWSHEPKWYPSNSSTCHHVTCNSPYSCSGCAPNNMCQWSNTYQTCNPAHPEESCTVAGHIFEDIVSLAGLKVPFAFGGIEEQTENFVQFYIIDGVMGIAYEAISGLGTGTLFDKLVKHKAVEHNIFAYCLNLGQTYPNSGAISFGGVNEDMYSGTIQYTPLYSNSYYAVHMTQIYVNGEKVAVPWRSFIDTVLDSGTNTLLVNTPTYDAIYASFHAQCANLSLKGVCDVPKEQSFFNAKCFKLTEAEFKAYPSVSLELERGVKMTMGPEQYLLQPNLKEHNDPSYCFYILPTGVDGFTIIGDIIMSPYVNVYDKDNKRYGIAPKAHCQ